MIGRMDACFFSKPTSEVSVKPLSLYLYSYLNLLKSGQEKKAQALISYALSETDELLSSKVMKILALSNKLYKGTQVINKAGEQDRQVNNWRLLRDKILTNSSIKVLFINDNGFNAGAGVGLHRQVQSFLNAGHTVQ